MNDNKMTQSFHMAGMFTLALRLVIGWTYFSALWRRVALTNKLDPESAGYIGEKFNHFLPNALGIGPIIEFMAENPTLLQWSMVSFTIIEGIVGLFIILGLFTRIMSVGVFGLAMGILLGAGWIGTTCLDEWQIGVLGIATGFTLFLTGSGRFSLDNYLMNRDSKVTRSGWWGWIGSGPFPFHYNYVPKIVLTGSIIILFITLFTNQYFHGGLWGTLHNKSVSPEIEIEDTKIHDDTLSFEVYRVQGVDVYGSFLIGVELVNDKGKKVLDLNGEALADFKAEDIDNRYVTKVKPGEHSLIIPLGAKATLNVLDNKLTNIQEGSYKLVLTDISGKTWTSTIIK